MANQYTKQKRQRMLDDYRRSNLSQEEFAKKNQINVGTFRNWLYNGRTNQEVDLTEDVEIPAGFVEVRANTEEVSIHQPVRLFLRDGVWFEMASMPSPEYVVGLLKAMGEC